MTSALQNAIDYLGAKEVAPGYYAFLSPTLHRWCVFPATVFSHEKNPDGFVLNVVDEASKPMPSWWTPEQRFAWRCIDKVCAKVFLYPSATAGHDSVAGHYAKRITADLNTGEEIPA